jgi:trimeric autotransporter adhesin
MRGIFIGLLCLLAWGSVARADLKAISPNVTSLANLPAIASGTLLGNSSGSTAAPSALTSPSISGAYLINGNNGVSFPFGDTTSVAIGNGAFANDATANERSIAIGYQAMGTTVGCTVTPGSPYDIAIGYQVLQFDTGCENTGVGIHALLNNTTGAYNVGIGNDALGNQTTATGNIAMGHAACGGIGFTPTGQLNTCLGNLAGQYINDTIGSTTLVGSNAGQGQVGTAVTGAYLTAVGQSALRYVSSGSSNTAVGNVAMQGVSGTPLSGSDNVAVGDFALYSLQGTGSYNVAVGSATGQNVTTGVSNTLIGRNTGSNITTGSANILVGASLSALSATTSNEINIGGLLFYNNNSTAAPAVSACGTSPSIDAHANNRSGTVTVGSGTVTSCTVTLAGSGYTTWNHCRVTPHQSDAGFAYSYTTTVITVTATSLTSEVFDYDCDGY